MMNIKFRLDLEPNKLPVDRHANTHTHTHRGNKMAEGFLFMPLGLVRLRTFRLSSWVT